MNLFQYLKPNLTGAAKSVTRLSLGVGKEFLLFLLALLSIGMPSCPAFGTSYPIINASTRTNLTDQTSKVQEELWNRGVVLGADFQFQQNPFADGMMGEEDFGKAIVKITDTSKVAGQVVNIPTVGGAGGPGVSGNGDRIGAEQKFQVGNFPVQIDTWWFGYGWESQARDQTVLRNRLKRLVPEFLRNQHAKKRSDDIFMKLIQAAGTGGRNLLFPPGVATRALLRSANVCSTPLISTAMSQLTGLGALPMELGAMDSGGSRASSYMYIGTQFSLQSLKSEPAYLDAVKNGGVRGDGNAVFQGDFVKWDSTMIYRWNNIDHGNWGSIGSPLAPRAYLGVAITNATTGTEVKGGGSAAGAAALPAPKYFEYFSSAPYTFHDGNTIAAVTDTDRYILIINPVGTYGVFAYRVNDGNKITLYTSPQVSIGVGTETDDFVVGALIVECNAAGVPFGRSLAFGREMVCAGMGSINGSVADPQMGRRTYEERNHGNVIAEGSECAWGCSVTKRADGVYPNFVLNEHSIYVPGAPIIV